MDGVASMHKDILAEASELCFRNDSDLIFMERVLAGYKTYIEIASSGRSCCSLAPGIYIDFMWHSHQCKPIEYSAFMATKEKFVDHEPCGELNPFDPTWATNTETAWESFTGEKIDPEVVRNVGLGCGCGCCCCQAPTAPTPQVVSLAREGKLTELENLLKSSSLAILSYVDKEVF